MERSVAAAAGERVDITGDVAVAVPKGSACWVVQLVGQLRPVEAAAAKLLVGPVRAGVGLALQIVGFQHI